MKENLEAGQAVCERCREMYHSCVCSRTTYKAHFLSQFHPLLHTKRCSVYLVTLTVKMLMYCLCPMLPFSYTENTQKISKICQLGWKTEFKKGYITIIYEKQIFYILIAAISLWWCLSSHNSHSVYCILSLFSINNFSFFKIS